MKFTKEQNIAFRTENKVILDGYLKGLIDFNTLVEERIAELDKIEAELWLKGSAKRKAYYVEKIKNLSSYLVTEIVNLKNYPRPKDCNETEKRLRAYCLDRLQKYQIDYAIILRHSADIARELGYFKLAPHLLQEYR